MWLGREPLDLRLMLAMSNTTALSEGPVTQAAPPLSDRYRSRRGSLVRELIGGCIIVFLSGFNVWWYWRDGRSLPDLGTVSGWMRGGQYVQAESALREHLRRAPHNGEARMMLARVLAGRGDLLGCARQLHEIPFWSPRKAEALLREGQSYFKIDRAKDAEAAWLNAMRVDPLHPIAPDLLYDVCQELLKLYAIEDRWEDAYPVIWTAYDHGSPSDQPVLLAMRIRPELERVAPTETIEILRRFVAAAPDDWEALRALARAEQALGNPTEAARLFQVCLEASPDNFRAWRDKLAMFLEDGDQDAFLALLEKPPKSAESEHETWMFRAIAGESGRDLQAAAKYFRKAIELNPFVSKYYYRLAMVEQRLGLHEVAKSHRARTKEMNEARAQLATAYSDYFDMSERTNDDPTKAAVCKHITSICETLGWSRAAQGWSRLASAP
jgi:tetratricopeptide (TPR) repeat protein